MKKCAANICYHLAWAPKVKLVRYKRDNNNDSNESGIANIVFLFFEKTGLQGKLISQLYWFFGILFSCCNYFRDFENSPFLIKAATFCSIRIKLLWDLLLRFWHFLNVDAGSRIPATVSVCISMTGAITDPEPHAHLALMDVITVSLNMADTMGICALWHSIQVHNTINWRGTWTFSTVESEIPTLATSSTAMHAKGSIPENTESCIIPMLGE